MAELWNSHTDRITTSRLVVNSLGLQSYRENSNQEYHGYFEEDILLGFINFEQLSDHHYLNQILVDKKRNGIGSQLLNHLIMVAKGAMVEKIRMTVQITNLTSFKFFLSQGFQFDNYRVETDFIPKNLDLSQLDLTKLEDIGEFLRLIEYEMSLLL